MLLSSVKSMKFRRKMKKVSDFAVHPYVQFHVRRQKHKYIHFSTSYIASFSAAHTTDDLLLIYGPSQAVPDTRWNWSSPTHFELHLKIEPLAISEWLQTVELKYHFTVFTTINILILNHPYIVQAITYFS